MIESWQSPAFSKIYRSHNYIFYYQDPIIVGRKFISASHLLFDLSKMYQ